MISARVHQIYFLSIVISSSAEFIKMIKIQNRKQFFFLFVTFVNSYFFFSRVFSEFIQLEKHAPFVRDFSFLFFFFFFPHSKSWNVIVINKTHKFSLVLLHPVYIVQTRARLSWRNVVYLPMVIWLFHVMMMMVNGDGRWRSCIHRSI